ncbi:MAG TPA: NUDIX hydrolase, partial [Magnetospirillaceae bacterium]|nr:NUDIX hydrolase [Magnetospirillaceae bacterium]
ATKAVIINTQNQVLILREATTYKDGTNHGRYHLPGGRLNPGEPFLQGLQREVREETGLEIVIGAPVFVGEWFPVIKGEPNQIVAVFFRCSPRVETVVLSDEHDDYQWVTAAELANYDIMLPDPAAIQAGFTAIRQ